MIAPTKKERSPHKAGETPIKGERESLIKNGKF